jgi:hypothetical protein
MPRSNISEREQANAKKVRQTMKKGLENYFGTGVRVPPPSLAGTPSDAAGRHKGGADKTANSKEGERSRKQTTGLQIPTDRTHTNSRQRRAEEDRQREDKADFTRVPSKKSPPKGSDDELSQRSKKTRSDDDASSPNEFGRGKSANLEAIKGLLRKKGSGTLPNGSSKKDRKTATFAEAITKVAGTKNSAPKISAPKITLNKCVVTFSVRVDKGKDTQVVFGKKIITALNFVQ